MLVRACDDFLKVFLPTIACEALLPISTALYASTEKSDVTIVSLFQASESLEKVFLSVKNDKKCLYIFVHSL